MHITPDNQFWWNWLVQFAVAFGTLAAAIIALFGEKIKAAWFHPDIKLELLNSLGERTTANIVFNKKVTSSRPCRYYHIKVSNNKKWPIANNVQIFLTRIEKPGPDDQYQLEWAGEVPLQWRFQNIQPLSKNFGPAYSCDLCSITKEKGLSLHPIIEPNNFQWRWRQGATKLRLHVEARFDEGVTPTHQFDIAWDGEWEEADSEIIKHFKISSVAN